MSDRRVSRDQKIPLISHFTAADLIEAVRRDTSISDVRRANEISAITQACRWVGQEPHNVALSTGNIRLLFEAIRRWPPNVTKARANNVCSLFRGALRRLGISSGQARELAPLTPEWTELFSRVGSDPLLNGCSRFARHCGAKGVRPDQVRQGDADEYSKDVDRTSLAKKPRRMTVSFRIFALPHAVSVR
jgi:hypothetical protein